MTKVGYLLCGGAYPALYKYFSSKAKHSGLTARFCSNYSEKLALMIDILQEIS